MKMSLYVGYVQNADFDSFDDGLRHMYKQGIRYGDIVDAEFSERPLTLYAEKLHQAGLNVNSIVATKNIASEDKNIRECNIAAVKGYIDQMEKHKIPYLMVAPNVKPAKNEEQFNTMRVQMIESLFKIADYAKGSGVAVCIENQSTATRADSKMQDIRYILDSVSELGYTLDAGNFFCVGEDVLKAYDLLKDRLFYAHFKDWRFDRFGGFVRENMPRFEGCVLGTGVIPLAELAEKLKEDGQDIPVTLEINSSNITKERLEESARFMKNTLLA